MIPIYKPSLTNLEKKYVNECLETGWISSSGPFVKKFEDAFARFLGVKYALSVVNGTSALHLLMISAGIGPEDEVIIPNYTFISTALAVSYTGAKIVPVDVLKDTWNINPDLMEKAITKKTKAIIPVDIYGIPVDIKNINKIAKKHNLLVLQDSAEAFGAEINNKKVGSEADGAIFSFYGNKTITTGEGGMLVTNSEKIYEKAKMLKDYGRDSKQKYVHHLVGYNYRMTNIEAAIGLAQLERVDNILKRKKKIKSLYQKLLANTPGIIFQKPKNGSIDSAWLISLVVDPEKFGTSKDKLSKILNKKGVESRGFFFPIHLQPIYQSPNQQWNNGTMKQSSDSSFPITNYLYQNGLSLPSYPDLTDKEIKYICDIIKNSSK